VSGAALSASWDFRYVMGHGQNNGRVFVVPENTYVLFIALPGESTFIEPDGTIDNFVYNYSASKATWFTNMATSEASGSGILRNIVYNASKPAHADNMSGRAFYEPGDIIQDINIMFRNEGRNLLPTGVFSCPLPSDLKTRIDEFNADSSRPFEPERTDKEFFDIPENLFGNRIFRAGRVSDTLYNVIKTLPLGRGYKQLLIVGSCRAEMGNNKAEKKRMCRTLSGNSRCRTCVGPNFLLNYNSLANFRRRFQGTTSESIKPLVARVTRIMGDLKDEENAHTGAARNTITANSTVLEKLIADIKAAGLSL